MGKSGAGKQILSMLLSFAAVLGQCVICPAQPAWKEICSINIEPYTTETQKPDPSVMLMGGNATKNEPHTRLFGGTCVFQRRKETVCVWHVESSQAQGRGL